MRTPLYWLRRENREHYAVGIAVASERLGVEKVRLHLHNKGLLTPEIDAVIERAKPTDDEMRRLGHRVSL